MCCLISVFNWFVIILTFVVLLVTLNGGVMEIEWEWFSGRQLYRRSAA
jgi:hypothetical protein